MSAALMAGPKKAGKPKVSEEDEDGEKEPQTSVRLYTEDVVKLGQLGKLKGIKSAAKVFRAEYTKLLDSALIAAAESRKTQLQKEQKRGGSP